MRSNSGKVNYGENKIITVKGREVALISGASHEYISLTDIAKYRNEKETFQLLIIGCEAEAQLSFWACGRN